MASGVALGLRVDVSSIALRRDFLFSLGLVVLSEEDSSVIVGDAISRRLVGDRICFGDGFAVEASSGLTAEAACVRAGGSLFGAMVVSGAGEATLPGLAVAPAVPVTSVPAVAPLEAPAVVRGPGLTP